jgi:hypothetical protein
VETAAHSEIILSIIFGLIINQFMSDCRVMKGCVLGEEANQLNYLAFHIKAGGAATN